MRIEVDPEAKTIRIFPQNDTDHQALHAMGFLEGGDCLLIVRQDIPGTSDLDFLDGLCTQEQYTTMRNTAKSQTIPGPQL